MSIFTNGQQKVIEKMERYDDESNEIERNNLLLSVCNILVKMDFDVLIRKRKSRNNKDHKLEDCSSFQNSNTIEHTSCRRSSTSSSSPTESTMKSHRCRKMNLITSTNPQKQKMKYSRHYYFSRYVTLLCLALVSLLDFSKSAHYPTF